MLQTQVIGYIGSDAEVKNADGREFTTFRVAHSDKWTDAAGNVHEKTQWVDVTIQGRPNVLPYLKKGQMIYASGNMSVRVYSSAKDRCMKAGLTINARTIELLGSKTDDVPSVLFNANDGTQVNVTKHYYAQSLVRGKKEPEVLPLVSKSQQRFICDRNGWVTPFVGED